MTLTEYVWRKLSSELRKEMLENYGKKRNVIGREVEYDLVQELMYLRGKSELAHNFLVECLEV